MSYAMVECVCFCLVSRFVLDVRCYHIVLLDCLSVGLLSFKVSKFVLHMHGACFNKM